MRVAVLLGSVKPRKRYILEAVAAGVRAAGDEALETLGLPEAHDGPLLIYAAPSPHARPEVERIRAGAAARYAASGRLLSIDAALVPKAGWDEGPRWWHERGFYRIQRLDAADAASLLPAVDYRRALARWGELAFTRGEWHERPIRRVLICDSTRHDLVTLGADPETWARDIMATLRRQGYEPVYRPHPRERHDFVAAFADPAAPEFDIELSDPAGEPLAAALARVDAVVTLSGTPALHAAASGVPAVTLSPFSLARPVTGRHVTPLEIVRPSRLAWQAAFGMSQWTLEELASGEAWNYLRLGLGAPRIAA